MFSVPTERQAAGNPQIKQYRLGLWVHP